MPIELEILRAVLEYQSSTGEFRWRRTGKLAGCKRSDGRGWQICLHRRLYLAHRLAWFWVTGMWPQVEIDHKDRNPLNNKWDNLREATRQQNMANMEKATRNRSGFKGVFIHSETGRFIAMITINKKGKNLGSFATAQEAHAAYCSAAKRSFGLFARF